MSIKSTAILFSDVVRSAVKGFFVGLLAYLVFFMLMEVAYHLTLAGVVICMIMGLLVGLAQFIRGIRKHLKE